MRFHRFPILVVLLVSVAACGTLTSAADTMATAPVLLQMIRDSAVHDELRISDSQRQQIIESIRSVDPRWFRSRNFRDQQRAQAVKTLTDELSNSLKNILSADQIARLKQLERQALGTRMVLRADVAGSLDLTPAQIESLRTTFTKTDSEAAEIQKRVRAGDLGRAAGNDELGRLKAREREQLASTLTADQKSKLGQLTGAVFDFGKVRRTFPLAPELEQAGVTWVQGGPQQLQDLKGKVVAIHFYAFQCINCQRNLPHYNAWHNDYADKDLVIIGIQSPETRSEEKRELVAAAAQSEGIDYPVMLDAEKSNWKAWSNTMWPTVYLIDKQGFIRRWWQGEMNWKGTPGEQQMRQTIEMLLAEEG